MEGSQNREAAFLGKITAGITHELRNVLAIIRESSGLIEDLLALAADGAPLPRDRVASSLSVVERQVVRGDRLLGHLNRLAHAPDSDLDAMDLDDLVVETAALAERFARQREATIEASPSGDRPTTVTSPIGLRMAVQSAIECCLNLLSPGATIHIEPGLTDREPTVDLHCRDADGGPQPVPGIAESPGWKELLDVAQGIGAKLEPDPESGIIRLTLPRVGA